MKGQNIIIMCAVTVNFFSNNLVFVHM